jgi:hypothetical protein
VTNAPIVSGTVSPDVAAITCTSSAIRGASSAEIAVLDGERVLPSRCARRLEGLGLIGI